MGGRVGQMLRLEGEAGSPTIHMPAFPRDRAVEEVARIERQPGFRGADLERTPAGGLEDARRERQAGSRTIQYEIVVVARAVPELGVVLLDPRPERGRAAEVERRPRDRCDRAGRDERRVDRRETIRVDLELMPAAVPGRGAPHVALAVLGQLHRPRPALSPLLVPASLPPARPAV